MLNNMLYLGLTIAWSLLNTWLFAMVLDEEDPDAFHVFLLIISVWAVAFGFGYAPAYKVANGVCYGSGLGFMIVAELSNHLDPAVEKGKKYGVISMIFMGCETVTLLLTLFKIGWFE